MLKIESLFKTFDPGTPRAISILEDINIQIDPGEFVILLGYNGSGKSTLLKLITGDLFPDNGRIFLNGKEITLLPAHARSKYIARVHQSRDMGLPVSLTVGDVFMLSLGRKSSLFRLMLRHQWDSKIKSLLNSIKPELTNKLDEQIRLLSGGEHQMINVIAAIEMVREKNSSSKLLLLDEHVAHLDPASSKAVMGLTSELVTKYGITTIMVTHNLEIASQYGNRILVLRDRKLVYDNKDDFGAVRDPNMLLDLIAVK